MLKSRLTWVLALLLMLSLVLVACGGGDDDATPTEVPATEAPAEETAEDPEPTEEPEPTEVMDEAPVDDGACEPVTVRWFIGLGAGSEEERQDTQDAWVDEFNDTFDCIVLEKEVVPVANATTLLGTQIAGGNAPEIVGPVGIAGSVAFADAIADLTTIDGYDDFDLSDYNPDALAAFNTDGAQTGFPIGTYPEFIYVNYDLFDAAELPYPPQAYGETYTLNGEELPWDLATVTEVAKLLTLDENGLNSTEEGFNPDAIVQFGYGKQWTDMRGLLTSFGANSFNDNGTAVIPESWAEGAAWYYEGMHDSYFMPNGAYDTSDVVGQGNYFASGNIAMAQTHLWYAACCLGEFESTWNTAAAPAAPGGDVTAKLHIDGFSVLEEAENKEAALFVLQWLLNEKGEDLAILYGPLPARESLQADHYARIDDANGFIDINWDVVTESGQYIDVPSHEAGMPNHTQAQEALSAFETEFRNDAELDVEAALAELQEELQGIFDSAE